MQCDQSWKGAQAHTIEDSLKTTPEGAERLDRRSEVLNDALAKEVERNVRRREEAGRAGELAVPRESKYAPIPPGSGWGKRRAMKTGTVDASSGFKMGGSRTVAQTLTQQDSMAEGSRMDVEGEEKDESRNSNAQNIRQRMIAKTSADESRMEDEGEEGHESRSSAVPNTREGHESISSAVPNTRRRLVTTTPLEENNIGERTVPVSTQQSLDGIREKARRVASLDEMGQAAVQEEGPVQGEQ